MDIRTRYKNWAAANPGLMFRKLPDCVKAPHIKLESFSLPEKKYVLDLNQRFHKLTDNAFNWHSPEFDRARLGGAIIMNILMSPNQDLVFNEFPLPELLPIYRLNVGWNNIWNFFTFRDLAVQLNTLNPFSKQSSDSITLASLSSSSSSSFSSPSSSNHLL